LGSDKEAERTKKQREQRSRENKEAERTRKQREQRSRENKVAERTKKGCPIKIQRPISPMNICAFSV
jgi:hypothetical protein